jgi:hypothetical protein
LVTATGTAWSGGGSAAPASVVTTVTMAGARRLYRTDRSRMLRDGPASDRVRDELFALIFRWLWLAKFTRTRKGAFCGRIPACVFTDFTDLQTR